MSFAELNAILSSGGGITIKADGRSFAELNALASSAKQYGATLVIKNAARLGFANMNAIASTGKGHVIFDLTE
jgi:hypothetical protein